MAQIAKSQRQSQTLTTSTGEYTDADRVLINMLFKRLTAIYPAWKQAYSSDGAVKEAKRAWMDAFINNNVTDLGLIKEGLRYCERDTTPFLPSVGQFMSWCFEGAEHTRRINEAAKRYREQQEMANHYSTQCLFPRLEDYFPSGVSDETWKKIEELLA